MKASRLRFRDTEHCLPHRVCREDEQEKDSLRHLYFILIHETFRAGTIECAHMKATDIIRRDHRAAEELFEQFTNAEDEEAEALEEKLLSALDTHEKMEDEHFYPALEDILDEDAAYAELKREQAMLEAEVAAARVLPVGRGAALRLAMPKVLEHAKKEEEEILPKAETLLGDEYLEELGAAMEPMSAVAAEERER